MQSYPEWYRHTSAEMVGRRPAPSVGTLAKDRLAKVLRQRTANSMAKRFASKLQKGRVE